MKKSFIIYLVTGIVAVVLFILLLNSGNSKVTVLLPILLVTAAYLLDKAQNLFKAYQQGALQRICQNVADECAEFQRRDPQWFADQNEEALREQMRFAGQQMEEMQRNMTEQQQALEQHMRFAREAQPVEFGGNDWTQFHQNMADQSANQMNQMNQMNNMFHF